MNPANRSKSWSVSRCPSCGGLLRVAACPWVVLALFVAFGCAPPAPAPAPAPSAFQPQIDELQAVKQDLGDCGARLGQLLASPPDANVPGPRVDDALDELRAIGDELTEFDRRVGSAMDVVIDVHLKDDTTPMGPIANELDDVQVAGQAIMDAFDQFVESASPDSIAPEFREVAESIRSRVKRAMFVVGLRYFRNYIPIRFVQFIETGSQILSDEWLQHSIDLTNQVFFPARIRFFMRDNNFMVSSEFADLDLRDPNGNPIGPGHYTWPEDLSEAPPILGIYMYPYEFDCPGFVRPPGNTETRDSAQMRAGTYCCPEGEILVYINQGRSNGGQYPWYSRIIGMSTYHMAIPNVDHLHKFSFAHEVGHYLGLPHVFPDHNPFDPDYSLARMTGELCWGDPPLCWGDPSPDQRRFYTTHANLRNVEPGPPVDIVNPDTGHTAELSLFWDMVFKPDYSGGDHMFFNSREEAAQWEADLQPIEQWGNVQLCRLCCGAISKGVRGRQIVAAPVRLRHIVAAGCMGTEGDFSDCASPVQHICTGDRAARAFSRYGSDLNKIHTNVMSYWYRMTDGTGAPVEMVDNDFLSESQLEQIDRVLTYDVKTRFFPERWGLRPQLGTCRDCHSQWSSWP